MRMREDSLIDVLNLAIKTREKYEKEVLKYSLESAMLATWKQILAAAMNGENIEIVKEGVPSTPH